MINDSWTIHYHKPLIIFFTFKLFINFDLLKIQIELRFLKNLDGVKCYCLYTTTN